MCQTTNEGPKCWIHYSFFREHLLIHVATHIIDNCENCYIVHTNGVIPCLVVPAQCTVCCVIRHIYESHAHMNASQTQKKIVSIRQSTSVTHQEA